MAQFLPTKDWYYCSRCGVLNGKYANHPKNGPICGNTISYDRIFGTTYCRRKLVPCAAPKKESK